MNPGDVMAFTGHRPNKLGGYKKNNPMQRKVRLHMREHLKRTRPGAVISGLAVGIDQWAAIEALFLGIPVIGAVPFVGQQSRWPDQAQREYEAIVACCTHIHVVCSGGYHPEKMQIRNRWMVDHCTALTGYWNGTTGGTYNCLEYAWSISRELFLFNPGQS